MSAKITSHIKSPVGKPFQENWLQTLTLSVGSPSARLVKPLINDIDAISQSRELADQLGAAQRVWEFAQEHHLLPLLKLVPAQQTDWAFPDQDTYAFRNNSPAPIDTQSGWLQSIGLQAGQFRLTATVTAGDWAELLRREAVRQRRTMSAQAMQSSNTIERETIAEWGNQAWTVRFVDADWITLTFAEPFETQRPDRLSIEEAVLTALMTAEPHLLPKALPVTSVVTAGPWADSVPRLTPLHQEFLSGSKSNANLWIRRAWAAVWPVIYREQNHLTQACELEFIRKELADCFMHVPKATLWMFAVAKLVCSSQLGRGLGVCGNFRRD